MPSSGESNRKRTAGRAHAAQGEGGREGGSGMGGEAPLSFFFHLLFSFPATALAFFRTKVNNGKTMVKRMQR